jgi:glucokinase
VNAGFWGVEIGGTKLQLVAGDARTGIRDRFRATVNPARGGAGIREQIGQALRTWAPSGSRPQAVGVGFGGPIDWRTGVIQCSHQIEGWAGFPLAEWLQQRSGAPVWADNDANVGALGEAGQGAGRGGNPVLYVTLGSGVGGGLVVDGHIYHGALPGEAEIGHVRLDRSGATVESRCSGWAVDKRIREHCATHPSGGLARLVSGSAGGEARHLATALAQGDRAARTILRKTAQDLAFGLSHAVHLFHPEIIVLGGGLSLMGEPLRQAVAEALPCFIMNAFAPGPKLVLARLGEDAVPMGALALAQLGRPPSSGLH